MKKRILSMLLAIVMVAGMVSAMGLTAYADPTDLVISDATYYSSGALKSLTTQFGWNTASAQSRLVLMTKGLQNSDLTNLGSYGSSFTDFDDALAHDSSNGSFGIVSYTAQEEVSSSGTNTLSISFSEGSIPLSVNKLYYVYLWTQWGTQCYPDYLIAAIKVQNGVVQYVPANGSNSYDESKFVEVVAQLKYDVTVVPGANMTKTSDSGAESQTELGVPMTSVVYTANSGYYFPEDYKVDSVNGIMVTRNSESQITISGMPTDDTSITLTAPTKKLLLLEETSFGYAYDVQRNPAFPKKNESIRLYGLAKPVIGSDTSRKDTNTGTWTLTNLGAYYYLKGSDKDTTGLKNIVKAAADAYGVSQNGIVIHELQDNGAHVAYGVVVMYDAHAQLAAFIGDTLYSGAGYLLSVDSLSDEVNGTATMNTTDWIESYSIQVSGSVNGTTTASASTAVAGDTITVTASPSQNYKVTAVTYNDGTDHTVSLTDGKYTFTMPASNVTVSATYVLNKYTVTYIADGETVDAVEVEHGGNATAPAVPDKTGYTGKWEADGKNITADTTINAVYAVNKYTVTYVADGETVDTAEVEHGGNATAPAVPDKTGYTGKWEADGKNITADTTINAVYTVSKYTVTYVADGKTVDTVEVEHGGNATAPAVPNKTGYTGKWESDGKNITGNTTIAAVYTPVADPNNPKTGDSGNLLLWTILALVSSSCAVMLTVKKVRIF